MSDGGSVAVGYCQAGAGVDCPYGSVAQVNFGYLEAGAVIAMVPCVLLYSSGLHRFYIRGLMSGVVKG